MTSKSALIKTDSTVRLAGAGLAILWAAASLWQQLSWVYASLTAITCTKPNLPGVFTMWTAVTTIAVVMVSAVFFLKIGVGRGHALRAGSAVAGVGLGISLLIGLILLGFGMVFVILLEGEGGPPATVTDVIDWLVVLGMFIVPPLAGIASLLVARSRTVLARVGSVATGRLSFGIAAGLSVGALVTTYFGVAINCGANWVFR